MIAGTTYRSRPTVTELILCSQCGASVPNTDGPTHAYYGAAPGCWELYGEVLSKGYSDLQFGKVQQLAIDAYAAQHPGKPERRTIMSVAVHLIGLYVALERGYDPPDVMAAVRSAAQRSAAFRWLDPPLRPYAVTVTDVHRAGDDRAAHERLVNAWARNTWDAWSAHHEQVRAWAQV